MKDPASRLAFRVVDDVTDEVLAEQELDLGDDIEAMGELGGTLARTHADRTVPE